MIFRSLRWRLQAWHGAVLALLVAGFGFTAHQLAAMSRWRAVDDELSAQAAQLAVAVPPSGGRDKSPYTESIVASGCYFAVWQPDGSARLISPNAPAGLVRPEGITESPRQVRLRGTAREVFNIAHSRRCFLVGRDVSATLAELRRLAWYLGGAGAGVLAVGLLGGWWVATRAIRPIGVISETAERIAAGDLSQRIPPTTTDDELGRLAGVLNSTFSRLDAAFSQQARFTADAAHELRTPVTAILMHAQNGLGCEHLTEEQREAFDACQRAARRMRKLIESLMELTRLDAGQESMNRTPFDLSAVVQDCLDLVQTMADARKLTVEIDLAPVGCIGDAGRIAQVVTNLLDNAIAHNRERGRILITTRGEGGNAVFTVTDTGSGIAADDLPHLFERFYRADTSRRQGSQHNGLGLAISKAIVDAHGGTLVARSVHGEGAVFTLRLPMHQLRIESAMAER